ncbi:hypothetical protein OIO90_005320 [Microbotryomycetes sp. JL221]|nr:hypothetical protein OIO90_005320 [Microbotryomycetes sp. JL221]
MTARSPLRTCCQRRTLFNFPSPFGSSSSSSAKSSNARGKLTRRGSIYVYEESKEMPYSQKELYSVIADVDSYQKFLPFAASSTVLSAAKHTPQGGKQPQQPQDKGWLSQQGPGEKWELDAELRIGAMGFDQSYVSKVGATKWESVSAHAKDTSVFSHLETTWSLKSVESASSSGLKRTQVDLYLAYAFVSPLHAAAISATWEKVSGLMIGAFEKRVAEVLGTR